jgi:hypothetical protein
MEVSEFKIADPGGLSMMEAVAVFYYRRPLRGWDIFSAVMNRESQ